MTARAGRVAFIGSYACQHCSKHDCVGIVVVVELPCLDSSLDRAVKTSRNHIRKPFARFIWRYPVSSLIKW